MAFSLMLTQAGLEADSISTKATVTLDKDGEGFSITKCHLELEASIPGIDQSSFEKLSAAAKNGCPVSKLFAGNAEITLDATLLA